MNNHKCTLSNCLFNQNQSFWTEWSSESFSVPHSWGGLSSLFRHPQLLSLITFTAPHNFHPALLTACFDRENKLPCLVFVSLFLFFFKLSLSLLSFLNITSKIQRSVTLFLSFKLSLLKLWHSATKKKNLWNSVKLFSWPLLMEMKNE